MTRRFQFSIRVLLAATVAVAAGAAAMRAKPSAKSALAIECLGLIYSTAAVVGVMVTSGKARTFWIGASLVLVPASVWSLYNFENFRAIVLHGGPEPPTGHAGERYRWLFWCAAPINGLFAALLHWLFAPAEEADS